MNVVLIKYKLSEKTTFEKYLLHVQQFYLIAKGDLGLRFKLFIYQVIDRCM